MHLWSPRRNKENAVKRSMSSPTTALAKGTDADPDMQLPASPRTADREEHGDISEEGSGERSYAEVARDGLSTVKDALTWTSDNGGNGGAATAKEKKEDTELWAPNLFYAYARRTNLPNSSRYLLTFSTARVCLEWWTLVQSEFGGPPSNIRESAQFFSFNGDDMPGRAWKNPRFEKLKTKWFYTQLGDAVGPGGKGWSVIPLQDERGFAVGVAPEGAGIGKEVDHAKRRASSSGSVSEGMARVQERRRSKRDSGVLVTSPYSEMGQVAEDTSRGLDLERMERNLEKVEKLMEQNAQQMRSLEHVQAGNLERLTAALLQNVDMVQELAKGQEKLGKACEEMRRAVDEREKAKDKEERSKRSLSRVVESQRPARSLSTSTVAPSVTTTLSQCGHDVRRAPRKLDRQIVGYIYANDEHGTRVPVRETQQRTRV